MDLHECLSRNMGRKMFLFDPHILKLPSAHLGAEILGEKMLFLRGGLHSSAFVFETITRELAGSMLIFTASPSSNGKFESVATEDGTVMYLVFDLP